MLVMRLAASAASALPRAVARVSRPPQVRPTVALLLGQLQQPHGAAAPGRRHSSTAARFNAQEVQAEAAYGDEAQLLRDAVYDKHYEPEYENFVALTGTLSYPTAGANAFSFSLAVRRAPSADSYDDASLSTPPAFDTWRVIAYGAVAQQAAERLQEGYVVEVQGKLLMDDSGAPLVQALDIGKIITPTPWSVVGHAGDPDGVPLQAANPQQYEQQQQLQPQQAVPGMPDVPGSEKEALWMALFAEPGAWYDNRTRKTGRQPDFKQKTGGSALWIDSNTTPGWVFDSLQLLPGGIGYSGDRPRGSSYAAPQQAAAPQQQQPGTPQPQLQQPAAAAGGGRRFEAPPPPPAGATKEDLWRDVFQNYAAWWDNRGNKLNPRAPDFKHKSSREGPALWISSNDTPDWVPDALPELPPPPPPKH